MSQLVRETKAAWQALGQVSYGPQETERKSLAFRRSLIAVRDIPEGKAIDEGDIRAIRPGYGLSPKYWPIVLGMRVRTKIERGKPIQWEDLG
jgi:N-acetylneuraminate synthase